LGQPIIGTLARIESYTKADIDRYHGRQYVGANAVVTLVGPQEREELKNIGMRFGSLPVGRRNEVTTAHVTKRQTQVILAPDDRSQCDCRLLFATHGRRHREGRALTILRLALDDGLASRMYERMATQLGLAYEQWALWESYPDVGAFELGAVLSPDKVLQFFTEARGLIESFVKEPPTGAELDRLRFRARWALESALESGSGLIALYGYPHLYGEEALTVDERMNRLFSVTVEELRATADSLLKRPAVAYCTGPVKGLSAAAIRRSLSTGP